VHRWQIYQPDLSPEIPKEGKPCIPRRVSAVEPRPGKNTFRTGVKTARESDWLWLKQQLYRGLQQQLYCGTLCKSCNAQSSYVGTRGCL